jgi:hypothetical protein
MVISTRNRSKKMSNKISEQIDELEKSIDSPDEDRPQEEEVIRSPLDEMVLQAEKAHSAYCEAERQLSEAYREVEVRDRKSVV